MRYRKGEGNPAEYLSRHPPTIRLFRAAKSSKGRNTPTMSPQNLHLPHSNSTRSPKPLWDWPDSPNCHGSRAHRQVACPLRMARDRPQRLQQLCTHRRGTLNRHYNPSRSSRHKACNSLRVTETRRRFGPRRPSRDLGNQGNNLPVRHIRSCENWQWPPIQW